MPLNPQLKIEGLESRPNPNLSLLVMLFRFREVPSSGKL